MGYSPIGVFFAVLLLLMYRCIPLQDLLNFVGDIYGSTTDEDNVKGQKKKLHSAKFPERNHWRTMLMRTVLKRPLASVI